MLVHTANRRCVCVCVCALAFVRSFSHSFVHKNKNHFPYTNNVRWHVRVWLCECRVCALCCCKLFIYIYVHAQYISAREHSIGSTHHLSTFASLALELSPFPSALCVCVYCVVFHMLCWLFSRLIFFFFLSLSFIVCYCRVCRHWRWSNVCMRAPQWIL